MACPLASPAAGNVGGGWTVDTSDGHLRFKHNGQQMLVLHNDSNANGVWTQEMGYLRDTLVKNGDPVTIRSERDGNRLQASNDFVFSVAAING